MSTSAPIPIIQNGLVFCYDTYNVKSYKGQPTTNYAVSPLDLYAWTSSANAATLTRDTSTSLSPVGGIPLKMVTSGADAYTNTYNSSPWNIAAASSGQTWTASVWVKANRSITNTTCELLILEANSSGTYITAQSVGFYPTTEWQRITYTLTLYSASTAYIQVRLDGPNSYTAGDIVWWDGLQVEQKSYATQFVAGTRSNTQGLIDLSRTTVVNLSAAGYDSNANINFSGSQYIITNSPTLASSQSSPFTMLAWNKPSNLTSWQTVFGTHGSYRQIGWGGTSFYYGGNGGGGNSLIADGTGSNNNWYLLAMVYDGTTAYAYKNGIPAGSSSIGSYTGGSNDVNVIGAYTKTGGEYFQGSIPIAMVYNRALASSEILQIYNSTKSRFGL